MSVFLIIFSCDRSLRVYVYNKWFQIGYQYKCMNVGSKQSDGSCQFLSFEMKFDHIYRITQRPVTRFYLPTWLKHRLHAWQRTQRRGGNGAAEKFHKSGHGILL